MRPITYEHQALHYVDFVHYRTATWGAAVGMLYRNSKYAPMLCKAAAGSCSSSSSAKASTVNAACYCEQHSDVSADASVLLLSTATRLFHVPAATACSTATAAAWRLKRGQLFKLLSARDPKIV
eukprot:4498-Heterococcus_DN1.PRE.2